MIAAIIHGHLEELIRFLKFNVEEPNFGMLANPKGERPNKL